MKSHHLIVISLSFISLLLGGCTKSYIVPLEGAMDSELAVVNVHVNDFTVSQESIPATKDAVADYGGMKAITLAFYRDGATEVYNVTQLKDNMDEGQTFGNFSLSLPMGSYTMVVIGRGYYDGDVFDLSSPTSAAYTSDYVRETFVATDTVDIASNATLNLNAVLNRVVSKVQVVSTDDRTAEAALIRTTFSAGGKAFSPITGLATTNVAFANTVQGNGDVGQTTTATSYLFLATSEQTMDVTIETLDSDGNTLFSAVVNNVPLKRNRLTTLTGAMYHAGANSSFTVNTSFIDTVNVVF